jgi:hypothetical protein
MAVLDIQRRHASTFNIRFGEKRKTANGNYAPAKLTDKIRVTSPSRSIIQSFADIYGGSPQPWNDTEWEVYLSRTEIPIMLLPGQSIDQHWELYKGGVCDRRCDGVTESKSKKPCMCSSDIDVRLADKDQCSIMTRLNFICPEVSVLGAGSLISHGKIAAETLPQAVAVAEAALRAGNPVPATLRCETQVGKGRQYVVPRIEITGTNYYQLASAPSAVALNSGDATAGVGQGNLAVPAIPSGGRAGQSAPAALEVVSVHGSVDETPPSTPAVSREEPDAPASMKLRNLLRKTANGAGMTMDELDTLAVELTTRYVDEDTFTNADAEAVSIAIAKKNV